MSDCHSGTGTYRNRSEALVSMLVSRLTVDELQQLATEHPTVVVDSIAEALVRQRNNLASAHAFHDDLCRMVRT
jgi:hypothetical protein